MGSWFAAVALTGRLPAFLVACGCLVLLYGFLYSGDYAVDDVTVRGTRLGDPFEIAGTTDALGESVFQVKPDRIAAQLTQLPYVQKVEVDTELPSRVVISMTERVPVMVWVTADGPFLIDAHGKVMTSGDDATLPKVDSDALELEAGNVVDPARVASITAVHEALGPEIDVISWNERNGVTVRLHDKRLLIFGEPDRFPLKLAVYQEFRTGDVTWSVLDLREPDRPFYE